MRYAYPPYWFGVILFIVVMHGGVCISTRERGNEGTAEKAKGPLLYGPFVD